MSSPGRLARFVGDLNTVNSTLDVGQIKNDGGVTFVVERVGRHPARADIADASHGGTVDQEAE